MKSQHLIGKHICAFAMALCTLLFTTIAFGTENNTSNSPSALFPETRFEFKPVVAGVNVTHSFMVKNSGSAPLDIEKVKTG